MFWINSPARSGRRLSFTPTRDANQTHQTGAEQPQRSRQRHGSARIDREDTGTAQRGIAQVVVLKAAASYPIAGKAEQVDGCASGRGQVGTTTGKEAVLV